MADIDMEVDTNRTLGIAGHIDDDLIDYDMDMADHEGGSLHGGENEERTEGINGPEDDMLDIDAEKSLDREADVMISEDLESDGHGIGNDVDMAPSTNDAALTAEPDYVDVGAGAFPSDNQMEEHDGYAETADETAGHELSAGEDDHASVHEIDYEIEEAPEQRESEEALAAGVAEELYATVDSLASNAAESGRGVALAASHDSSHDALLDQVDDDEITWEEAEQKEEEEGNEILEVPHEEAHEEPSQEPDEGIPKRNETASEDVAVGAITDHEEAEVYAPDDEGDYEAPEDSATPQHDDGDHDNDHVSEPDELEATEEDHADEEEPDDAQQQVLLDASHEEPAEVSDSDFPEVTVQYKGDEFPFFSTTSDGFFTEAAVLDYNMEKLLASFREELANEIAYEDELVFQVDELGLEFAESSSRDSLSSVTLRQILEIFDLLVKNQDPDTTRTLYTYLFPKPSTSKRLESLIDNATAGKGLDEVIRLFQSPVPANAGILIPDSAVDGFEELLDEFDTPVDENGETYEESEQVNGEVGDEEIGDEEVGDEEVGHEEVGHEEEEAAVGPAVSTNEDEVEGQGSLDSAAFDEAEDVPEEHNAEETIEEDGYISDAAAAAELADPNGKSTITSLVTHTRLCLDFCLCDLHDTDCMGEHEPEEARLVRSFATRPSNPQSDATARNSADLHYTFSCQFRAHPTVSPEHSFTEADHLDSAFTEDESNHFTNLELDHAIEAGDKVDLGPQEVLEDFENDHTDGPNTGTADSSTTTTLRGEDETVSTNAGTSSEAAVKDSAEDVAAADEDELAEIDWRDQPDEAEPEAPDTPSAAGKRARAEDDENDVDDEKDVKRRRS
ncbi:hypothetical protein G7046_g4142 [Stylonectria norvegica]|nr:hypothetical protein G7046_g4142 [Stylonectria norvegica]